MKKNKQKDYRDVCFEQEKIFALFKEIGGEKNETVKA